MSNKGKFSNTPGKKPNSKLVIILSCVAGVLALGIIALILLIPKGEPAPTEPSTVPTTVAPSEVPSTVEPSEVPTTVPEVTEPSYVIMDHFVEMYNKNPDFAGWITIEGTKLDNPVMYTPEDDQKYLYANFEGKYSFAGLPYVSGKNSLNPEDDNLIIYGHNMVDGTMFGAVMQYANEDYFKEHPIIKFSTLYEEREYEVMAAFYDKIYLMTDECFKFYRFYNAETEEQFNEAYNHYKTKSEYDTGVTAEFGDRFITLVTCSYHDDNGRFVVVARLIDKDE